jgi:beta-glucosidase
LAHYYRGFRPANPRSPLDRWLAKLKRDAFNELIPSTLQSGHFRFLAWRDRLSQVMKTQDFIGLNYYTREQSVFRIDFLSEAWDSYQYSEKADISPTGFIVNEPEGLWEALRWAKGFQLPIYITENGTEDPEGKFRPRYLAMHLHQIWRGVNFNWPIRGYFHWTLVDNFEWERGWTQRFGLWELDPVTQKRRKRPSADLYAEICQANGLSSEMVAMYAPEIFDELFPPRGPVELAEAS